MIKVALTGGIGVGKSFVLNILKDKYINTAQLDAEILMEKVIGKDKKYIILNSEEKLNFERLRFFKTLIKKRSNRKPIAYLINKKFFL